MKKFAITALMAGGLVAGALGMAGAAQAEYGQPDVSGVAPFQGPARSVDAARFLPAGHDHRYNYDDRYYYDAPMPGRYDTPYYDRPAGPTFSVGPNGVVFGFPISATVIEPSATLGC